MIVEYIRYKIDPTRTGEFRRLLPKRRRATRCLPALPALGGNPLRRRAREADRPHRVGLRRRTSSGLPAERGLQALPRSHRALLQRHRGDDALPSHRQRMRCTRREKSGGGGCAHDRQQDVFCIGPARGRGRKQRKGTLTIVTSRMTMNCAVTTSAGAIQRRRSLSVPSAACPTSSSSTQSSMSQVPSR